MRIRRLSWASVSTLALASAACLGSAGAAQAQEDNRRATTVQEVTITAERRVSDLQTTAISATVLNGEALEARNVVNLTSLQFAAPGLQISDYSSANTFNIRGIGQSAVNVDLPSGVVIYRDGVPTLTGYFQNAPYFDMAGVEVLRGPQGTFVGKSAAAGAVFIRTRDPELGHYGGDVSVGAGNRSAYEGTLVVNVPIGDTLAVRLSMHAERRGSLFDSIRSNPLPGSVNNGAAFTGSDDRNLASVRLGILWQPTAQFRAIFKVDADYLFFGSHITSGIVPATGVEEDMSNPIANGSNIYRDQGERSSLNMRYTFGNGIALSSLTGVSTVNTRANWDSNGSNPAPSSFHSAGTFTNVSQEFNLISPDTHPFRWVTGLFFQRYENHIPDFTADGLNFFTTDDALPLLSTPWDKDETSYAAFGQVAFDITPRLELQLGARYSHYEFTQFTQWTLPLLGNIPFTEPAGGVHQDFSENSFDWKVNLNYDLSPTQFIYGLISRGHAPGSINVAPNPVTPAVHTAYSEMQVINYEAGWKGQFFDRRLRTQIAAYYQTFDNYQAAFAIPAGAGIPAIDNVSEFKGAQTTSRIYGIEIGAQAHFGDFVWDLGFAYNRSKLGDFGVVTNPFAATYGGPAAIDLNGARTPFSPEITLSVGAAYTFHLDSLGSGTTLTPRVDVAYHSNSFANLYANRATLLPAETLVNANLRLEHGPWWATLWVTNLTDRRYPGAKQNVDGSTGVITGIVYQAPPRLFGIRFGRSF